MQLNDTAIFDISLSCYNSTIHWNKIKDSNEYYLSLHETCYNVTTGEMVFLIRLYKSYHLSHSLSMSQLPDYPNCVINGRGPSGNKSIRRIGEFDDIVCSYSGCIMYLHDYCNRNIPHIGNCTNPTQISKY